MNTHIPCFERAQEAVGNDEVPLEVSSENLYKNAPKNIQMSLFAMFLLHLHAASLQTGHLN